MTEEEKTAYAQAWVAEQLWHARLGESYRFFVRDNGVKAPERTEAERKSFVAETDRITHAMKDTRLRAYRLYSPEET